MSDESLPENDVILRIEAVAFEFEALLRGGGASTIEEVLACHPRLPERELLRALIETELDMLGETFGLEQRYRERFADHGDLIDEVFAFSEPIDRPPLRLGESVANYRVSRLVGKGAIGFVYLAEDVSTGQHVAIKILRPDWKSVDRYYWELFQKEAGYARRLNHPRIVKYLRSGTQRGLPYHVFEYIEGDSLKDFRKKRRVDAILAAKIVSQIAEAVGHAHQMGVIHRDLKPTNVLLDQLGNVHLADFGVAIEDQEQGTGARFAGSILYMSPEQVNEQSHHVDARSDVYSLGVILYELLTGDHPTCVNDHLPLEMLIDAIKHKQPRPFRSNVPKPLRRICLECLWKNPLQRFNSAEELKKELIKYVDRHQFKKAFARIAASVGMAMCFFGIGVFVLSNLRTWRDLESPVMSSSKQSSLERIIPEEKNVEFTTDNQQPPTDALSLEEMLADGIQLLTADEVKSAATLVLSALKRPNSSNSHLWKYFASGSDNSLQTALIHMCASEGLDYTKVLERIRSEPNPDLRYAFILALGEYSMEQLSRSMREELLPELLQSYCTDPSAAVHSAYAWLLRKWNYWDELDQVNRQFFRGEPWGEYEWFHDLPDITMVAFKKPGMATKLGGQPFAISSYELTNWQMDWIVQLPHLPRSESLAHEARHITSWHQCADYCNKLSSIYGFPKSDTCYIDVGTTSFQSVVGADSRPAFRMPTVEEWTFAARANSTTRRFWGRDDRAMGHFARFKNPNTLRPFKVGGVKPNGYGLFDVLGNVSEWMHSTEYSPDTGNMHVQRPVRGGSVWTRPELMHVDEEFSLPASDVGQRLGLRTARTLELLPFEKMEPKIELKTQQTIVVNRRVSDANEIRFDVECRHVTPRRHGLFIRKIHRNETVKSELVISNPLSIPVNVIEMLLNGGWKEKNQVPFPCQLAPGASLALSIDLDQSSPGLQTCHAALKWDTSDGLGGGVQWDLQTFVSGPAVTIFGENVANLAKMNMDFGVVVPGTEVKQLLSLVNIGDEKLTLLSPICEGAMEIAYATESVGLFKGQRMSYEYRIVAKETGILEGSITIPSDDPMIPVIRVDAKLEVRPLAKTAVLGLFRRGHWHLDYNRDGTADVVVPFGKEGDLPLVGDFDGDGVPDLAFARRLHSNTELHFRRSSDGEVITRAYPFTSGQMVVADWNTDGRSDLLWVFPSAELGVLCWKVDSDGDTQWDDTFMFGLTGDSAIIGDWNADGEMEAGVVRVSPNGQGILSWTMGKADEGKGVNLAFGLPGDLPVTADLNGDGQFDAGVYRIVEGKGTFFFNFHPDPDSESFVRYGEIGDIPIVYMSPPWEALPASSR